MAITVGTLVFTGERKFQGVQYLGYANKDRTVAQTIIKLCRQYSNVTAYEVQNEINFQIEQLKERNSYPGLDTLKPWTIEEVKRHMYSVARRSQENGSKYIPHGIEKLPHSEYYIFRR